MKNFNLIIRSIIMLTALVAFTFVESDVMGQTTCWGTCGINNDQTYSHSNFINGGNCNNASNGGCGFAAGLGNTVNGDFSGTLGVRNTVDADTALALGAGLTVNAGDGQSITMGGNITSIRSQSFNLGWSNSIMYADLRDAAGNGWVGLRRTTPVSLVDIDLSVAANAEKGAGGSTWINPSDRRLKTNIQPFEDGLDVLMKFDPVSFYYNGKLGLPTDQKEIGVIAQDVRKIAPYMVTGKEGADTYLGYNANALFYIITNSIQEQQEIIETERSKRKKLEKEVEAYKSRLKYLEEKIDAAFPGSIDGTSEGTVDADINTKEVVINAAENRALLYQNKPNPFSNGTVIKYYVPDGVATAELLIISTETGTLMKRVTIYETGFGEVRANFKDHSAGTYTYTLVIDGKESLTRQMVLSK